MMMAFMTRQNNPCMGEPIAFTAGLYWWQTKRIWGFFFSCRLTSSVCLLVTSLFLVPMLMEQHELVRSLALNSNDLGSIPVAFSVVFTWSLFVLCFVFLRGQPCGLFSEVSSLNKSWRGKLGSCYLFWFVRDS